MKQLEENYSLSSEQIADKIGINVIITKEYLLVKNFNFRKPKNWVCYAETIQ